MIRAEVKPCPVSGVPTAAPPQLHPPSRPHAKTAVVPREERLPGRRTTFNAPEGRHVDHYHKGIRYRNISNVPTIVGGEERPHVLHLIF